MIENLLHFEGNGQRSGRNDSFLRRVAPDDDLNDLEEILNHHNLLDIVSSSRWNEQQHQDGVEEISYATIKQSYHAIKQSISVPGCDSVMNEEVTQLTDQQIRTFDNNINVSNSAMAEEDRY